MRAVWPAATVASTASPIDPPIWNDVFTRPDASPEFSRATPVVAVIVVDTNEQPMPAAQSSDGRSTSAVQDPSASICENSSIPAPSTVIPVASTRPGPQRAARRLASCVKATMVSEIGANVRPASSAEKPSTCCT